MNNSSIKSVFLELSKNYLSGVSVGILRKYLSKFLMEGNKDRKFEFSLRKGHLNSEHLKEISGFFNDIRLC